MMPSVKRSLLGIVSRRNSKHQPAELNCVVCYLTVLTYEEKECRITEFIHT